MVSENQLVEMRWKIKPDKFGHHLQYRSRLLHFDVLTNEYKIGTWGEWLEISVEDDKIV